MAGRMKRTASMFAGLLALSNPAATDGASTYDLFCAIPDVRIADWTPIMKWANTASTWETYTSDDTLARRQLPAGQWKYWGIVPTYRLTGSAKLNEAEAGASSFDLNDLEPLTIGPEAFAFGPPPYKVGAGKALVVFASVSEAPPAGFDYRIQNMSKPLRFVSYLAPGTKAPPALKSANTVSIMPAPTKPYNQWLRRLGCKGCLIERRTPTGWTTWNAKTVTAGETYRIRRGDIAIHYAVIPTDDPRC